MKINFWAKKCSGKPLRPLLFLRHWVVKLLAEIYTVDVFFFFFFFARYGQRWYGTSAPKAAKSFGLARSTDSPIDRIGWVRYAYVGAVCPLGPGPEPAILGCKAIWSDWTELPGMTAAVMALASVWNWALWVLSSIESGPFSGFVPPPLA